MYMNVLAASGACSDFNASNDRVNQRESIIVAGMMSPGQQSYHIPTDNGVWPGAVFGTAALAIESIGWENRPWNSTKPQVCPCIVAGALTSWSHFWPGASFVTGSWECGSKTIRSKIPMGKMALISSLLRHQSLIQSCKMTYFCQVKGKALIKVPWRKYMSRNISSRTAMLDTLEDI